MEKLKLYIVNGFFSALIGAVIEFVAVFVRPNYVITFPGLMESMEIGIVIGTVSLFFILQVTLRLTGKPALTFLTNFLVVALMILAGAFLDGIRTGMDYVHSRWLMVLIVAELLSFGLTLLWYRKIKLYNSRLRLKKESLPKD